MGTAVAKAATLSDIAAEINENHELARMYVGQAFDHAVKAGLLLMEAKAQVQHGKWLAWLKANVKVSSRQAQNYMKVASCPEQKRNAVADLSLRKAIHELAAHKVQEGDREAARALTSPKDFAPVPDDDELPNTGCNYDPADERGEEEGEPIAVTRRRAWLYMADEARRYAESLLAKGGHRAIAKADADEIDLDVMIAAFEVYEVWGKVTNRLYALAGTTVRSEATSALKGRFLPHGEVEQASTLPQDGRSEVGADDPTPENGGDDMGDNPAGFDRRSA